MTRAILQTRTFTQAAKRVVKRRPHAIGDIRNTLILLSEDIIPPRLQTPKLNGVFEGSWACNAGYDIRIIFKFVRHKGEGAILLETLGSQDEVY